MEQSTYTKISKSIGTQGEPIDLPTMEEAEKLFKAIKDDQSVEAFTTVFKLNRFGKSPKSYAEEEVSSLIYDAFCLGSKLFR